MLLRIILMMLGAMCPAPVDWLRLTRSDIADTIMIMRRDSTTCKADTMIRQIEDLSMRMDSSPLTEALAASTCSHIAKMTLLVVVIRPA